MKPLRPLAVAILVAAWLAAPILLPALIRAICRQENTVKPYRRLDSAARLALILLGLCIAFLLSDFLWGN